MQPYLTATIWEKKFKKGDDFQEAFLFQTKKYKKIIDCFKVNLITERYDKGDIEFLLVDAMKSWELCNSIFKNFYPSLKEGKSSVLHQDFAHYYTYWIHLLHYELREYFSIIPGSNTGNSLCFRYSKKIPAELFARIWKISDFSEEQLHAAFNYSLKFVKEERQEEIYGAKVLAFSERFGKQRAQLLLHELRSEGNIKHEEFFNSMIYRVT
jgi:hypothetical protein